MSRPRMVLALHFHQPFGNLERVFEDATDRCYAPTIDLLAERPRVLAAAHVSGPLLDWLERKRPDVIDALRALAARGQLELLGGGDQEPMLAVLPERDAHGQLVRMAERCASLFGRRPTGMWLAERVWEPDLARVIAEAGYRYTLLDDAHLFAAGVPAPLGTHYLTEKAGACVAVLPIDRGLRTRIPFGELDDVERHVAAAGRTLVYGDDVEKFGLWPTTERRVWRERWLERFFDALSAEDAPIGTVLPGDVLDEERSAGPVYLPTVAYAELGAWALPTEAALAYRDLLERLERAGLAAEAARFLRGGIWQNFLAKYPEARWLHRRMLRVSAAVERARLEDHPRWQDARDRLYQGQCNCAFWHGLFGGLYLQHLRAAVARALLSAEDAVARCESPRLVRLASDGDREAHLLLESPWLGLELAPDRGGVGLALELRRAHHVLSLTLGRRPEPYHADLARARVFDDEELGSASAHDVVRATEPDLVRRLVYDHHPRGAFVAHVLPPAVDAEAFDRAYHALAPLHAVPHRVVATGEPALAEVTLSVELGEFMLTRRFTLGERLHVAHRLASGGAAREVALAVQLDVTLLAPDEDDGRRIEVTTLHGPHPVGPLAPGARATARDLTRVRLASDALGIDLALEASPPCELWRLPIETVSRSERGFEPCYQGTCLVFVWRAAVGADAPLGAALTLVPLAP